MDFQLDERKDSQEKTGMGIITIPILFFVDTLPEHETLPPLGPDFQDSMIE
jgi:hypothetical protein